MQLTKLWQFVFPKSICIYVVVMMNVWVSVANAELTSISDEELSGVGAQGIGFVLDDFMFSHGTDANSSRIFKITGITNSKGDPVEVSVSQLYIARGAVDGDFSQDSDYGQNLQPFNLGRLTNPYEIDVVGGASIGYPNKSVLQILAPAKVDASAGYDCIDAGAVAGSGTCSSRPATSTWRGERFDFGLSETIKIDNQETALSIHAKSAVVDGSHIRFWAGEDRELSNRTQLVSSVRLNFYTPELSINTCDGTGQNCGSPVTMRNFQLELALGNALQPAYLDVTQNGHFVLEVRNIRESIDGYITAGGRLGPAVAPFTEYYEDPNGIYKSNLKFDDISLGGTNFGSARIEGLTIQYLRIETHDL